MISLEQYRVVIGLHNLRHHNHVRLSSGKKVVCVLPVLLAVICFVAVTVVLAGDVERNPGPRCIVLNCRHDTNLHRFPRDPARSVHFETVVFVVGVSLYNQRQ